MEIEYEYCKEIANSERYKKHLEKGWELDPGKLPEDDFVRLRRKILRSTTVRFQKDLE